LSLALFGSAALAAIFAGSFGLGLAGGLAASTAPLCSYKIGNLGPVIRLPIVSHKNRLAVTAGRVVRGQAAFYFLATGQNRGCFGIHLCLTLPVIVCRPAAATFLFYIGYALCREVDIPALRILAVDGFGFGVIRPRNQGNISCVLSAAVRAGCDRYVVRVGNIIKAHFQQFP
jgi:hypothetical protein